MPRFLFVFILLILFSGIAFASKTAKDSEMEQMESSLLQQQMQKIEKSEKDTAAKKQPDVVAKTREQETTDSPQQQARTAYPVAIETYIADPLGEKMALLLKENFNKSSFFLPVTKKKKRIILRVTTLNEFSGRPGLSSVYVFTWLFSESEETIPYFLDNTIGTVDATQIEHLARQILMQTTDVMEKFSYLFEASVQEERTNAKDTKPATRS